MCLCVLCKALLNVGEGEKAAEPGTKQPPQGEAAAACGCNKPCNCPKPSNVVFSDLYSTGTGADSPDPHTHTAWPSFYCI